MIWMVAALLLLTSLELGLRVLVRRLRRDFQWLITDADEEPSIASAVIDEYMLRSFDPELGWLRKPATRGVDRTEAGEVAFHIAADGTRCNPGFDGAAAGTVVFGDSFAFGRLVADDHTWPHFLSHELGHHVANYGVGNYGLDQAVLRLEREIAATPARDVLIAMVPETVARINSYWKHYFEYGNVLAFKPVFVEEEGRFRLLPPAVRNRADFDTLTQRLHSIRAVDPFYRSKFRRDMFTGLYLRVLLLGPSRNRALLFRLLKGINPRYRSRARSESIARVLEDNFTETRRLYGDGATVRKCEFLARRASELCRAHGKRLTMVIIPQLVDLENGLHANVDYHDAVERLRAICPVEDFSPQFARRADYRDLYVHGALGPHLSRYGNACVAAALARTLGTSPLSVGQDPKSQ